MNGQRSHALAPGSAAELLDELAQLEARSSGSFTRRVAREAREAIERRDAIIAQKRTGEVVLCFLFLAAMILWVMAHG